MSSEIVLSCYAQSFFIFQFLTQIFFSSKFAQFTNVVDVYFFGIGRVVFRVGSRGLQAEIFDMAFDRNAV